MGSLRKNIMCQVDVVCLGEGQDLRKTSAVKFMEYPEALRIAITRIKPKEGEYYHVIHAVGSYEYWGPTVDGNAFEEEEMRKGAEWYKKIGKPYINHWMGKGPIGEIIESVYDELGKRILLLTKVTDAAISKCTASDGVKRIIIDKLRKGERIPVSNGVDPEKDVCSICGNERRTYKDKACEHIKYHIGEVMPDGKIVAMLNKTLKFDDISFLTLNPADRSAYTLKKVASEGGMSEGSEIAVPVGEDSINVNPNNTEVFKLTKDQSFLGIKSTVNMLFSYLFEAEAIFGTPSYFVIMGRHDGSSYNSYRGSVIPVYRPEEAALVAILGSKILLNPAKFISISKSSGNFSGEERAYVVQIRQDELDNLFSGLEAEKKAALKSVLELSGLVESIRSLVDSYMNRVACIGRMESRLVVSQFARYKAECRETLISFFDLMHDIMFKEVYDKSAKAFVDKPIWKLSFEEYAHVRESSLSGSDKELTKKVYDVLCTCSLKIKELYLKSK